MAARFADSARVHRLEPLLTAAEMWSGMSVSFDQTVGARFPVAQGTTISTAGTATMIEEERRNAASDRRAHSRVPDLDFRDFLAAGSSRRQHLSIRHQKMK